MMLGGPMTAWREEQYVYSGSWRHHLFHTSLPPPPDGPGSGWWRGRGASASLQRGVPLCKQDILRGRRRRGYDPNDERYYVSDTNTGPEGSLGGEEMPDGREGSMMLNLLQQRVTKGSRRRMEVNNDNNNNNNNKKNNSKENNNTDVKNLNEEKRKGPRVEGRREERQRGEEEKGGRQSRERGSVNGQSEQKGGSRRSVEERQGVVRRSSAGEEERRGKAEAKSSLGEAEAGRRQKPVASPANSDMSDKGVRRRRKETELLQKKKEEIQQQSLAPLSPVPDYPSISPRLSRSIQCLATLDNLAAESPLASPSRKLARSSLNLSPSSPNTNTASTLHKKTSPASPPIPAPDYEDKAEGRKENGDLWGNARRYRGQGEPRETLKVAMKNRPPVAEIVKEITKVSEEDKRRQRAREKEFEEAGDLFAKEEKEEEKVSKCEATRGKRRKEPRGRSGEHDAQKIYREILEVVKENSPASLQYGRGRMVGYGEEAQDTLRRGDRSNAAKMKASNASQGCQREGRDMARIRLCEDRESVTTSIDSYPFSPSSPWAQGLPSRYNRFGYPVFPQKAFGLPSPSGPVSFAGFSSPASQLTSSSGSGLGARLGPPSLQQNRRPGGTTVKKKRRWFAFFQ